MQIVYFFSAIVTFLYLRLIINYIYFWNSKDRESNIDYYPTVSIIVVARNEEMHIANVIESIILQNYPKEKFELILVNDNSSDRTQEIIENYTDTNIKSLILNEKLKEYSKKFGIEKGISYAKNDIILLTDADCAFSENWIRSMVLNFSDFRVVFVAGPVTYFDNSNMFSKLLNIEFASLIGSTASSIYQKKPMMSNGANMAFRKSVFLEVDGYKGNFNIPSGDDVFLMLKLKEKYPDGIWFAKDFDAIVETDMPSSITDFVNQRIRWASKVKFYKEKYILFNGFIVLAINYLLVGLALYSFVEFNAFCVFLAVFILKTTIDYVFLKKVLRFFKKDKLAKFIIIEELLYPIYIILISSLSFKRNYSWKGRKVKT